VKTRTTTTARRRTSVANTTGETTSAKKPEKPSKSSGLQYDFAVGSVRGVMALLVSQTTVKAQRKYIRITEWPRSLVSALDAGLLTGEAETLAKGLKAMSSHPFRQAFVKYRKPTPPQEINP